MADITMCSGQGCPFKDNCYRHLAKESTHRQSYFTEPPVKFDSEQQMYFCEHYQGINDGAEGIWQEKEM